MDNRQTENLQAIFDETLNQFNYSSNLFDNLESRANLILVSISMIFIISLSSYFLNKIDSSFLIVRLIYYSGILLNVVSFILILRVRKRLFEIIKVENLKEEFIKSPNKNFKKIVINKYIPIIKKNIENYEEKEEELRRALLFMKIGILVLLSTIIYILLMINFY